MHHLLNGIDVVQRVNIQWLRQLGHVVQIVDSSEALSQHYEVSPYTIHFVHVFKYKAVRSQFNVDVIKLYDSLQGRGQQVPPWLSKPSLMSIKKCNEQDKSVKVKHHAAATNYGADRRPSNSFKYYYSQLNQQIASLYIIQNPIEKMFNFKIDYKSAFLSFFLFPSLFLSRDFSMTYLN